MSVNRFFCFILLLLFGLTVAFSAYADNPVPIRATNLGIISEDFNASTRMVELGYDDGGPAPNRDDPGPDWITYDNGAPQSLYPTVNLWSRVQFTPNAEYQLQGVRFMPLNQGPNPDAPCNILVYREDQDSHDLTDLVWEGQIESLEAWDRENLAANWHWIEIEEDDRPVFEGGENFTIIYGPAPGGEYPGGEGDGWWNLFDGASEVRRSYMFAGDAPVAAHANWSNIAGGDLLMRANGVYQGDFVDLGVESVFNAEEEIDRNWIVLPNTERSLFAEITNNADDIEEFIVVFSVMAPDGDEIFEEEVVVDGLEAEETIIVSTNDAWVVPADVGHYSVWVTIDADNDANNENDMLGLDQIVYDQEESREMWIGFVDTTLEGSTSWNENSGWGVRFDHPGGPMPLWITAFRVGITGAAGLQCPFTISTVNLDNDEFQIEWEGSQAVEANQTYVTVELEEDDYVSINEGEGLMIGYYYVNGGNFRSDNTPPIAGTNTSMPASMMRTQNDGESYDPSPSGDFAMQIQLSGPDHGGFLSGTVLNAEDDSPMEDVVISTSQDHRTLTNEEGYYEIVFGPRGEFSVSAFKQGFNIITRDGLELEEGEELEVNFSLTHPEFEPSIDEIETESGLGGEVSSEFTFNNPGNGPLIFSSDKRLPDEVEVDPWTLREAIQVGDPLDDSRIEAVLYIDGSFYVAGANDGNPTIYVLTPEGELINEFAQPGDDATRTRCLAWDGERIWLAIADVIYAISTDGEELLSFESPYNPVGAMAWDTGNNWLWVSSTTTDPVALDVEGNEMAEIDRQRIRIYGFGWWEDDPDGFKLYVHHKDADEQLPAVNKFNPESGEMEFVTLLVNEVGGDPGGASISNEYDPLAVSFITSVNDGAHDRIDIWQIAARRDWFELEPPEGTVEAGDQMDLALTLNASNLPVGEYNAFLDIHHNAGDGEAVIPISFNINGGPAMGERTLQLENGWNMVSVNLQPEPDDVVELTAGLVDEGLLLMVKNGLGNFYRPEFNFNNIERWDVSEGYLIKMDGEGELRLRGITVMPDEPIDLVDGWQMISYYPRNPVDAVTALSGIVENLILAKDGAGRFYNVEFGFSNMGDMVEGNGYQLKLDGDAQLVYTFEEELANIPESSQSDYAQPCVLPTHSITSQNMSLLVKADDHLTGEIGVYAAGELVGSGRLEKGSAGIAVWGDDISTEEIDGAKSGQALDIMLINETGQHKLDYDVLAGNRIYTTDSFLAIGISNSQLTPEEFGIYSAFPNPFNSTTLINYGLPEAGKISISVYDLTGRRMFELFSGNQIAGIHQTSFDGSGFASGVYLIKLAGSGEVSQWKVVLMK